MIRSISASIRGHDLEPFNVIVKSNRRQLARISCRDRTNNIKGFAFPDRREMGKPDKDHCAATNELYSTKEIEGRGMRLTLRTLLAWLDDTLKPTEVREIGRQVAGSPFAQELSERIHRVTRQRRLSVPSRSGPEGTDPNMVAAYLDNDLDHEAVAEFEKKCLTSDVNLAEVASVHQILSLLGQKVRVPAEARTRMYQLVKGRETIPTKREESKEPPEPEPVTKPIQPWVLPEPSPRPWFERFGPVAACVVLIMLVSWSAWRSLTAKSPELLLVAPAPGSGARDESIASTDRPGPELIVAAPTESDAVSGADNSASAHGEIPAPSQPGGAGVPDSTSPAPNPEEVSGTKVAKVAEPKTKEPTLPLEVPPGAAGLAEPLDGILLRYNPDDREWIRLTGPTPLSHSDRLLCLAPSRALVSIGKLQLSLLGETEIRLLTQSSDKIPAIELLQGRVLLGQAPTGSLKVVFSERAATLELSPGDSLALARSNQRLEGQLGAQAPPLEIYCTQGEASVIVDQKQESLSPSSVVTVDSSGKLKRTTLDSLPSWSTETEPSAAELQVRAQFVKMIHPGRPVLTEIVAASEDEHTEIKQLSISALKALGDLSYLMPMLSRKDDRIMRLGALAAVRDYIGRGPDDAKRALAQLEKEFGEETGSLLGKMLVGFTAEEASKPETYQRLVGLLAPEQDSIGLRELALDTLKRLTGRGDLGYDPDHPEGKGLNTWKELERKGELRPPPREPKAE